MVINLITKLFQLAGLEFKHFGKRLIHFGICKNVKKLLIALITISYIKIPFLASTEGGKSVSPNISRKSISITLHNDNIGISFAIP